MAALFLDIDSDSDDEFLMDVALRVRNEKVYRVREENFRKWNHMEFFMRFRLT
jgi:hypothetical protein